MIEPDGPLALCHAKGPWHRARGSRPPGRLVTTGAGLMPSPRQRRTDRAFHFPSATACVTPESELALTGHLTRPLMADLSGTHAGQ
jgi:hypothetical protein